MTKGEETLLLALGGLVVLWLLFRPSTSAYASAPASGYGTGGGIIGSVNNIADGVSRLLRTIGGTSSSAAPSTPNPAPVVSP